jgi:hypothetical protein
VTAMQSIDERAELPFARSGLELLGRGSGRPEQKSILT